MVTSDLTNTQILLAQIDQTNTVRLSKHIEWSDAGGVQTVASVVIVAVFAQKNDTSRGEWMRCRAASHVHHQHQIGRCTRDTKFKDIFLRLAFSAWLMARLSLLSLQAMACREGSILENTLALSSRPDTEQTCDETKWTQCLDVSQIIKRLVRQRDVNSHAASMASMFVAPLAANVHLIGIWSFNLF